MNATLVMIGLLAVIALLVVVVATRMRNRPEIQPAHERAGPSVDGRDQGEDAYREVARSIAAEYGDLMMPAFMSISKESRKAANEALRQAVEAGSDAESARKAAIDTYRSTFESMAAASRWQSSWTKNAWAVDSDAYREIAKALENEHGEILLHSTSAITRVLQTSETAAIGAYRQAGEDSQDTQTMRTAALEVYKATLEAKLVEEQTRESNPLDVRKQLDALSQAQIKQIEQRMLPGGEKGKQPSGVISVTGFLAPGESLIKRIEEDERTLAAMGITPDQVADRLETLVGQASRIVDLVKRGKLELDPEEMRKLSESSPELLVSKRFLLTFTAYMGCQECPFDDERGQLCKDHLYGEADFTLKNVQTKAVVNFPGLIIHLIREHHFFEGAVPYRVDPRDVAIVLELQPGVDYRPCYNKETVWRWQEGTGDITDSALDRFPHLRAIKNNPGAVMTPTEGVCLYFRGDRCLAIAEQEFRVPPDFVAQGASWGSSPIHRGIGGLLQSEEFFVDIAG